MKQIRYSFRFAFLLAALITSLSTIAQSSNVSRGRVFWMGFMQNYDGFVSLKVYVSSPVNTTGIISAPLLGWAQGFSVAANGVATLDVPATLMHWGTDSVQSKGILVVTNDSVSVYALSLNAATTDASSILPIQSIGSNYRVQAYKGLEGFGTLNSEMLVVGAADSTHITITPSCNTLGGHLANVPFDITLQTGQTYQVQADSSSDDLTGTLVHATSVSGDCHPFAVFGGSVCPDIPVGCYACDHVFEQMVPLSAWGVRYFLTPFTGQTGCTIRVLANEDNTQVAVDGSPLAVLNAGNAIELNDQAGAHCIGGDKPISVAQFMQGNSCSGGNSDPAMLILNKDEEVATDITFATVVTPLITEQFVNVVGITGGLAGMIMDGASVDTTMFAAFPSCTDRMWATFPLAQGTHTITAPHPFTAYVYGQGPDYESYAYGLGTASANVSDTLICAMGGTVTLTAPAYITNGYWFNVDGPQDTLAFGNTYTFTPMGSTSIGVSQIGTGACTQGRRYHIGITTPVTIVVTADPGTVCAPGQVQLNVDVQPDTLNIVTVWDPPFLMDDALSTSPIATVLSDTWFHVHVTGDLGCSVSVDSVHVIAYPSPTATIMQAGNLLTSNAASDYQWFIGGAPIPGANSQNYVITLDGSYQVLITDANGCQAMSDTLTAIYQGISELGVAQMQLYADRSGAIIIHSDRNIEAVDVFDLLGQQVARSTEHANTVRVPVMSDGVYLVKVRIADNMLTRRLVVVR